MDIDIEKPIEHFYEHTVERNGYCFTSIDSQLNVYNAIEIIADDVVLEPSRYRSKYSLNEHINFINNNCLERAKIVAKNIDFITMCPSLKYLQISPFSFNDSNFDYSKLYEMPEIKSLECFCQYGKNEEYTTTIDCSKIKGLEQIYVYGKGYLNLNKVSTLKSLYLSEYDSSNLIDTYSSLILDSLYINQCKIKSLNGIEKSKKLQCLYLDYNKHLSDIGSLYYVKDTLKALRIDSCGKIKDFSVLSELINLEYLALIGNNRIPNLSFIKSMKNLKTLIIEYYVEDGDLLCMKDLQYASVYPDRRHYCLKNDSLHKGRFIRGNESIEIWRRFD